MFLMAVDRFGSSTPNMRRAGASRNPTLLHAYSGNPKEGELRKSSELIMFGVRSELLDATS